MADRYPAVTADLGRFERADASTETVFQLPTAKVDGHTVQYEDRTLGGALAGLPELDGGPWRFLFATRLTFVPPLAPGIGTGSVFPTVASEAASNFATRLRERGFENVERGSTQRMRVDSGERARLRKYTATYDPGTGPLDVEGWTAVWPSAGHFLLAGGAYPTRGLAELLERIDPEQRPDVSPATFRDELLELVRSVE